MVYYFVALYDDQSSGGHFAHPAATTGCLSRHRTAKCPVWSPSASRIISGCHAQHPFCHRLELTTLAVPGIVRGGALPCTWVSYQMRHSAQGTTGAKRSPIRYPHPNFLYKTTLHLATTDIGNWIALWPLSTFSKSRPDRVAAEVRAVRLQFAQPSAVGHSGHRRSRMGHSDLDPAAHERRPWSAGQNIGPTRPLKPRDIWAIRFFLDENTRLRDRASFDLAIDSKQRSCDVVKMRIGDLLSDGSLRNRATVIHLKTGRPVQFEIMTEAQKSLTAWLTRRGGTLRDFSFPSRVDYLGHLRTRQYARLVDEWISTASWTSASMGHIPFGAPRFHSFTRRPATCGPCKYCLAIPTSRTRFAISASTSTSTTR